MKRLIVIFACLAFATLVGLIIYQANNNSSQLNETSSVKTLDKYKIYDLVNDYRASKKLPRLTFDPSMCDFTAERLLEIHSDFSHSGYRNNPHPYGNPKGSTGENLIRGYNTEREIVTSWINSPEHRANMLSPRFTRTCIETDVLQSPAYEPSDYAVQEFADF